jgi:hypothetical protein
MVWAQSSSRPAKAPSAKSNRTRVRSRASSRTGWPGHQPVAEPFAELEAGLLLDLQPQAGQLVAGVVVVVADHVRHPHMLASDVSAWQ